VGRQVGTPGWDAKLGRQVGTPSWDAKVGTPSWDAKLGRQSWDAKVGTPQKTITIKKNSPQYVTQLDKKKFYNYKKKFITIKKNL
jgi:hypothetical protein